MSCFCTKRSTIFVMAGRMEMGRVSEGFCEAFPLGIGITIACFQDEGTSPVEMLEFMTSRRGYASPSKNFWSIWTLIPSLPVAVDGLIASSVAKSSSSSIGWTLKQHDACHPRQQVWHR